MKFFVTKKQLKYWQNIKLIEGFAKGTTTANQAIADQLDTMSANLRIYGELRDCTHGRQRKHEPIERER